jgi:hypothetical protein
MLKECEVIKPKLFHAGNTLFHLNKKIIMSNLLYIIALILLIGWFFGFFVFSAGGLIHVLLVIAVIAVLFRLIRGRAI